MASFLKNTGDIILDAVLTDEGRRRLAMGDGSFKITKFALGDDEINYSLWDKLANSGQEDLAIMRTPIFEAYTNNASSMKNKLMTMAANNILFMPVLRMNTGFDGAVTNYTSYNSVIVPVYATTEQNYLTGSATKNSTLIFDSSAKKLSIHQGIDSSYGSDSKKTMTQEGFGQLVENEYNVIVDNRLLYIADARDNGPLAVDDDYMATYSFSLNDGVVSALDILTNGNAKSPILGSRGTKIEFRTLPQNNLANSGGLLFSKLGSTITGFDIDNPTHTYNIIRTMVKVVGTTTGYSIEIPVILAKKQ